MNEPEVGRGFVAVVPPEGVLDTIGGIVDGIDLPGTARRTTRPQWHLTLQFLGNRVDFGAVASELEHLALRRGVVALGGAGAFPTERRGRVLWLGVAEGATYLAQLAAGVGALVGPIGYSPEARAYHAHLTLARLKATTDLRATVASLQGELLPEWPVEEVVLFRSRTSRSGASYEARARIPLAG